MYLANPCLVNGGPCKNGGTCVRLGTNGFACLCAPKFTDLNCSVEVNA